jgi:hypothetical protein
MEDVSQANVIFDLYTTIFDDDLGVEYIDDENPTAENLSGELLEFFQTQEPDVESVRERDLPVRYRLIIKRLNTFAGELIPGAYVRLKRRKHLDGAFWYDVSDAKEQYIVRTVNDIFTNQRYVVCGLVRKDVE